MDIFPISHAFTEDTPDLHACVLATFGRVFELSIFVEEYAPKAAIVVSNERAERRVGKIRVMPWRSFLDEMWAGGLIG